MRTVKLGISDIDVPQVVIGCMHMNEVSDADLARLIHSALEQGCTYFDHADIYGKGECEEKFGRVLAADPSVSRDDVFIQSKCSIRAGFYDMSYDWIMHSVEGSLARLQTDHLDMLLIHRPDTLVEPDEVARAFDELETSGMVLHFGVSNHKPSQMELLRKTVRQPLLVDQMQFSIPVSDMVSNGIEVNTEGAGAVDRDESTLDWCRLNDVTIQAWSPFQRPSWRGPFIGDVEEFGPLNEELSGLAGKYGCTPTTLAAAWVLRHPAGMQLVSGTTKVSRLGEVVAACDVSKVLTREDWYALYRSAGHPLP
jgi:predicted oxidoreductase